MSTDPNDGVKWILDCTGSHNHGGSEPTSDSQAAWSQLEDIVTENPNIIPSKLAAGTDRKHECYPSRNIDPKL